VHGELGAHSGFLVGISRFELGRRVRVGDTLRLSTQLVAQLGSLRRMKVRAEIDGEMAAQGELSFSVQA
jgi:hypothetical protein